MSIFIGVILAIASLIFTFQNNEFVNVTFLKYSFEGSLALVILASLLIGFLVAFFFLTPSILRSNSRIRNLQKSNQKLSNTEDSLGIKYESEGLGEEGDFRKQNGN